MRHDDWIADDLDTDDAEVSEAARWLALGCLGLVLVLGLAFGSCVACVGTTLVLLGPS